MPQDYNEDLKYILGESKFLPEFNLEKINLNDLNNDCDEDVKSVLLAIKSSGKNQAYCSVAKVIAVNSSVEKWVMEKMLFPPTTESLKKSIEETILSSSEKVNYSEALWFIASVFKQEALDVFNSIKNSNPEKVKPIYLPIFSSITKSNTLNNNEHQSYPASYSADRFTTMTEWFKTSITSSNELSPSKSVKREAFGERIKQDSFDRKGNGEHVLGYWFQDFGIHGLCGLNTQELEDVINLWPPHNYITHHQPSAMFGSRDFWSSFKKMSSKDRKFLMENVLPEIIDRSLWTEHDFRSTFESLIKGTEKYGWLFLERLKLWQSFGGSLDQKFIDKPAQSAFEEPEKITMRDFILKSGVDTWIKEVESLSENKSKTSNKPMPK